MKFSRYSESSKRFWYLGSKSSVRLNGAHTVWLKPHLHVAAARRTNIYIYQIRCTLRYSVILESSYWQATLLPEVYVMLLPLSPAPFPTHPHPSPTPSQIKGGNTVKKHCPFLLSSTRKGRNTFLRNFLSEQQGTMNERANRKSWNCLTYKKQNITTATITKSLLILSVQGKCFSNGIRWSSKIAQ